jgi:hypothetical protein
LEHSQIPRRSPCVPHSQCFPEGTHCSASDTTGQCGLCWNFGQLLCFAAGIFI